MFRPRNPSRSNPPAGPEVLIDREPFMLVKLSGTMAKGVAESVAIEAVMLPASAAVTTL